MTLRCNFPLGRALAGSALALPLLCLAPSSAWAGTTLVTNTKNDGVGSLRRAIQYANANPGTTIRFEIPAADPGVAGGVARIKPTSELPKITAITTILDGASQTAFAGNSNPNGPEVELDGSNAGFAVGIRIQAARCTVNGLAIIRFQQTGILIQGPEASANKIQGCYLGLTAAGAAAAPNFHGVFVYDGARRRVAPGAQHYLRQRERGGRDRWAWYGVQCGDRQLHRYEPRRNCGGTKRQRRHVGRWFQQPD
jgi:hypothetical protein